MTRPEALPLARITLCLGALAVAACAGPERANTPKANSTTSHPPAAAAPDTLPGSHLQAAATGATAEASTPATAQAKDAAEPAEPAAPAAERQNTPPAARAPQTGDLATGERAPTEADMHVPPIPGLEPADHLLHPDERHFAKLWKLTSGGENAEAYWSFAGDRLVLQRRNEQEDILCDRIFVTHPSTGALEQVSDGRGATTCAFFLPSDRQVVFASTGSVQADCPPPPDLAQGYVWALHPEHDLFIKDLDTGATRQVTTSWGYDAEATVAPTGDRIVFTSTRSGDLELWTCALDGSNPVQVTDRPGYDGGAFFSHDGKRLVFRATVFDPAQEAEQIADYRRLLADWRVRPSTMEIFVCDADGSNRRQVTALGGANWAPYFTPDDQSVLFTSNHHVGPRSRNFDIFVVGLEGGEPEPVTRYEGFDSFPMFSPNGEYLAFSSNRGGATPGETNVFIAKWRDSSRK